MGEFLNAGSLLSQYGRPDKFLALVLYYRNMDDMRIS